MTGTLDGLTYFLLILVGSAGDAARQYLALFVHKLQQEVRVLIVYIFNTEFFEAAILLALRIYGDGGQISYFVLFVSHNNLLLEVY